MNRDYLLSTEKTYKSVLLLSTPSAISTLSSILYSLIDTMFIGKYTFVTGITAVSIYVPIQMLISAITLLFSTGIGTNISIFLGKKDKDYAEKSIGSLIIFILCFSSALFIIGMLFSKDIVQLFGASGSVINDAILYAKAMFIGILFYPLTIGLNSVLRAEGSAKYAMNGALISILSNILLDFLLIVIFHLGILGAGLATTLSKGISLLYILYIFKTKTYLKIKIKNLNFDFNIIKKSLPLGVSSFLSQTVGSLAMVLFNHELLALGGNSAIAIYGIVSKVTSSIQEFIMGFTRGAQPLIGYNFGAKNIKRIKETLFYTILYSIVFGSLISLIIIIFSKEIMGLFSNNSVIIDYGNKILILVMLTTPFVCIYYLSMSFFRGIRRPKEAIFLSISRRLLFFIPFIYLFPYLFHMGITGAWIVLPLSNILAFITGVIFFYLGLKKLKVSI
ncbi:MAG: MATE family efflux transporter [Clostridium sp.]|uniref:MATE family efflux transporter n=1 Tax=Clostridium sp. TaxID=1506 RepID=UPI003F3126B9